MLAPEVWRLCFDQGSEEKQCLPLVVRKFGIEQIQTFFRANVCCSLGGTKFLFGLQYCTIRCFIVQEEHCYSKESHLFDIQLNINQKSLQFTVIPCIYTF